MKITDYLLNKYNVPVPRYTSYPPANHFNENFREDDFIKILNKSNTGKPENIAIYIHIPFCRKICSYCGCNSCLIGNGSLVAPYIEAIKKEITLVSQFIDKRRLVSQVHYGGGTPNSISFSYLKSINDSLFSKFSFIPDPEIAIECDPSNLDLNYIDELLSSGFNRISFGIQDLNSDVLRKVNRKPPAIPPEKLLEYIKSGNKKTGVNFDFIYGLPGQSVDSFVKTMQMAAEIKPDRLVTFSYAHVPWIKKHQLILEKKGLPPVKDKTEMFLSAYDILKTSGYKPVGLDHFVLPGDDLYVALSSGTLHRNFQGYCTRKTTGQVYAFGITAISQLADGYSQNKKEMIDYLSCIEKGKLPVERGYILSNAQQLAKAVITDLMCNKKVRFSEVASTHDVTVNDVMEAIKIDEKILIELEKDDLITYSSDEIKVTETGSFFIRNVAASLDKDYREAVNTYSKPV
jgi:oxygen-independent coproporphyrinogen-3 oxidase